jgi:predicted RNA-binding protein Jag
MAKSSVYEGRSYDEAVKKGLDDLGLTRAEATITLIEEGKGGFLGLGSRPFRVSIMRRPGGAVREPEERGERRVQGSRRDDRRGGRGGRDRDRGREGGGDREGRGRDRDREGRRDGGRPQQGAQPATAEAGRSEGGRGERSERGERGGRGERRGGRRDRPREDRPREDRPREDRPREDRPQRPAPLEAMPAPAMEDEDELMPVASGAPGAGAQDEGDEGQRRRRRRGRRGGRGRRRGGEGDMPRGDAPPAVGGVALEEPEMESLPAAMMPVAGSEPPAPERAALQAAPPAEPVIAERSEMTPPPPPRDREHGRDRDRGRSREEEHSGPAMSETELAETSKRLTENLLQAMGFEATVTVAAEGDRADVTVEVAQDDELLTGQKGEVRQAMQHLLNRFLNRGEGSRYHLQLEINDFWKHREDELAALARSLAEEALSSNSEVVTEYLNSQERRIVHVTLRENTKVKTYALGTGMIKRVAVAPADFPDRTGEEDAG